MSKYDISFLKNYLTKNELIQLSKKLNIDYYDFYKFLNGNIFCDDYTLIKLLKYYNTKTYEELKFYVSSYSSFDISREKIKEETVEIDFNIMFLKRYLQVKNIKPESLAYSINIETSKLYEYLNGASVPNFIVLKKIYKVFNVSSYYELFNLVCTDNTSSLDNIKLKVQKEKKKKTAKKYDIKFLKEYLEKNYIKPITLSKLTNMSRQSISLYLNGKSKISEKKLKQLLTIFKVSSYDELLKLTDNSYDLNNLLYYLAQSKFLLNKNKLKIINDLYNDRNLLLKKINVNIIDKADFDDNSKNIIKLLFNPKIELSLNEISYMSGVPLNEILKIYNFCIQKYLEKVYYNNVLVKRLKNENSK